MAIIINESLDPINYKVSASFPMGWWVDHNGKYITVSRDAGPGDHMGWLFLSDGGKYLGLSTEECQSVMMAYDTEFSFEHPTDNDDDNSRKYWWWDDRQLRKKYLKILLSKSPAEWFSLFNRTVSKVQRNWMRVLYHTRSKELAVQVPSRDRKWLNGIQEFMLQLMEHEKIDSVVIEDYNHNLIVNRESPNDVLLRKRL